MLSQHTSLKDKLLQHGNEFTVAGAKEIVNELYDHYRIDTKDPFHNFFFYEMCPLVLIAEHVDSKKARLVFMGALSRFDGLIILGDERKTQKVELTAAIDGHNDSLQMELLGERGQTPAFQKIQATGTKRNREFGKNELTAIRSEQYIQETLFPLLENALALKKEKAKKNQYYTGAWLGIVFDDRIIPLFENKNMPLFERKKERFDPVCRQVLGNNPGRHIPFSRVFCVGLSRQYLFDSCER